LEIERQLVLEPQDEVGEQHASEAEEQQRNGVGEPALFAGRIDPAETVGQALHRADWTVQPGAPIRIEHLHEVQAERLGDEDQRAHVERELGPGIEIVHATDGVLSFIR